MFAPSCFPPGNPEGFVNANLVSAMLDAGWLVDVITCADGVNQWYPDSAGFWRDVGKRSHSVLEQERTLFNLAFSALETAFMSGQLVGGGRWAVPAVRQALRLVETTKYDLIMSRSLPPMAHLAASICSGKTGIPWIANWNDPDPIYMFPEPYRRDNGGNDRMGFRERRHYRALVEKASWHTFPCERLRVYVGGYLPGDVMGKSSVVPHIAMGLNNKKQRNPEQFTLMHAGSLRPPRDAGVFLHGIRLFHDKVRPREDVLVRFIVDRPEDVAQAASAHGVEHLVRIEKSRPYAEMPDVLAEVDVLVIIEAMTKEGIFLPSKFVDYLQSGRPILAVSPRVGTLADILSTHGGGEAVDSSNPESVAQGITRMYESWRSGRLDAQFGSDRLYPLFDREATLGAYRRIFEKIGLK